MRQFCGFLYMWGLSIGQVILILVTEHLVSDNGYGIRRAHPSAN